MDMKTRLVGVIVLVIAVCSFVATNVRASKGIVNTPVEVFVCVVLVTVMFLAGSELLGR